MRTTPARRWADYYDTILTTGESAAEIRLFGLGPSFRASYQALRRGLVRERLRLTRSQMLTQAVTSIGTLLICGAALLWMLGRTTQGLATLGDLVLFYQVFDRGQSLARLMLSEIGQIYGTSLFLGNLFAFL
jgi:ATP-binding cassette subfamily B protein